MSNTAIQVANLSKEYLLGGPRTYSTLRESIWSVLSLQRRHTKSPFLALDNVSFDVDQGEVVGIVGRNGAGKSTLLKLLSRITTPSEGSIEVSGRVGSLLEVGTGFHPELTGRENIFLNGAILGMKRADVSRRFDEIVEFAEVADFLELPVKRYSSGMYMRLAFAVAAHLEPEVLVVDEVLAVGDVAFQKKCLGKMEHTAKQGRTILFVSHNMAAVQQLTTKCMLLDKGKLVSYGHTDAIIRRYQEVAYPDAEVYDLTLAKRPMNDLSRRLSFKSASFPRDTGRTVSAGDSLRFVVKVAADSAVRDFRFSCTVLGIDGTPVGSSFGEPRLSVPGPGNWSFAVTADTSALAPGRYMVHLAVGQGTNVTGTREFDIVAEILHFEVLAQEGVDGTRAAWYPNWGHVVIPPLSVIPSVN